MKQSVIVGVDGTPDSLHAAGWAADEARRRGAPLLLLHGHEPTLLGDADRERQAAEHALHDALTQLREQHPDVEARAELVARPEAELLTERGREAEMIVLGSRRPGPVAGFLLGSVGLRVVSRTPCPVVMVRGGEAVHRPPRGAVVAGVPPEEDEATAVLDFAFETAAVNGVPLRAARAWALPALLPNRTGVLGLSDRPDELDAEHRRKLVRLLKPWRRRYPDIAVTEHVERGFAADMLVNLAAGARLLVVGRGSTPGSRYVGHVVHATLHFANAPVAVVPTR
ncbi:universal stress protein [Streptomyces sp. NBC_01178]|uniref:universal stress protein n=1 Tax=Streptomyces sp. NBC_01178 TaxID=2903762 RepID=UPI003864DC2E|nr:universal stress protein [Streptomyces sp. NBC_01178]